MCLLVDGVWSSWLGWTCSVSCGNGSEVRNRTCIGPFHGGMVCPVVGGIGEQEIKNCSLPECPGMYYNKITTMLFSASKIQ